MSKQTRASYVINITTGVVTGRTSATDRNPMIFRLIDDETARAIIDKKVTAWQIVGAIDKNDRSAKDFNFRYYNKRMAAAEKALNVSQRDMVPLQGDPSVAVEEEKPDEGVLTLSALGLSSGKTEKAKKAEKPEKKSEEADVPSGY